MRCLADNSLGQAAKVLLPLGVPGTGLTRPRHCLSGDILQSCRPPEFQGASPPEAASQDANDYMPQPAISSRGSGCSPACSTCSAQDWPSPTPPVSMGAGVSEQGVSEAGASATGGSSAGVS